MERWHSKLICGIIMFIAMPICFLVPVKMAGVFKRWGARGQHALDMLSCFAGGVFLASYLVFMAPAVRVLIEVNLMTPNNIVYPLPDMLIGLGFIGMLVLDKIVKIIYGRSAQRNNEVAAGMKKKKTKNPPEETATKSNGHCTEMRAFQPVVPISDSGAKLMEMSEEEDLEALENWVNGVERGELASAEEPYMAGRSAGALSRQQSIVDAAVNDTQSIARSIITMLALSIDSVLEGMTIGLKQTVVEVWAIFIGIIVHESVIAFCLGLQLVRVNRRLRPVILASIVYTLMNPIGLIIATAVYETCDADPRVDLANGILQALTSGCFIYVIFYEILEGQINQDTPFSKISSLFVGYAFLASFALIPGSSPYSSHGGHVTGSGISITNQTELESNHTGQAV